MLLALALLSTQDLVSTWSTDLDPLNPGVLFVESVAFGDDVVVSAYRSPETDELVFDARNADGSQRWRSTVPNAWEPGPELVAIEDLALSADGETAFALIRWSPASDTLVLRVLGFDLVDGSQELLIDVPPKAGSSSSNYGRLAVLDGQLVVLGYSRVSGVPRARLNAFDDQTGAALMETGPLSIEDPEIAASRESTVAVLWNRGSSLFATDTTLIAVRPSTGSLLWSSDAAVPDGATAVAIGAGGTLVARAEGSQTRAFELATGDLAWTRTGGYVDEVVAYGPGAFFLCGQAPPDGLGSGTPYPVWAARVDAATGVDAWSVPFPGGDVIAASFPVKRCSAAVDLARDRVAFSHLDVHVLDATNGALVGLGDLTTGTVFDRSMGALDGARWVARAIDLNTQGFPTLESFDDSGALDWALTPSLEYPSPLLPRELNFVEATGEVHSKSERTVSPTPSVTSGRWEVFDAETGSPLRSWYLPFKSGSSRSVVSPDGSRIATFELFGGATVWVQDAADGTVLAEVDLTSFPSGDDYDLVWDAGSSVFAVAADRPGFRHAALFGADGALQWDVSVPTIGPQSDGAPRAVFDAVSGDLLTASVYTVSGDDELRAFRYERASGAELASLTWDGSGVGATFNLQDRLTGLHLVPGSNRVLAVVDVAKLANERSVWCVEIDPASWTVARELEAFNQTGLALPGSTTDLTPDGGALLLAGRESQGSGAFDYHLTTVDVASFSVRSSVFATADYTLGEPRVVAVDQRIGALFLRHGPYVFDVPPARVELYDLETGTLLERLDETDLEVILNSGVDALGQRLFHLGWTNEQPGASVGRLEALDLADFAAGPDEPSVSGDQVALVVHAGPERAGDPYLILGSLTGTAPGTPIGALNLPLVADPYTTLMLTSASAGPFSNTFGLLDPAGAGSASIALPAIDPSFVGLELHHAALILDPIGVPDAVAGPSSIVFGL